MRQRLLSIFPSDLSVRFSLIFQYVITKIALLQFGVRFRVALNLSSALPRRSILDIGLEETHRERRNPLIRINEHLPEVLTLSRPARVLDNFGHRRERRSSKDSPAGRRKRLAGRGARSFVPGDRGARRRA